MAATLPATETNDLPKTRYASESLWLVIVVIVVGNIAGTMGAADQLCKIPLQNILKGVLHVQAEDTARFFFLTSLFFYLKPLAGILTDAFPLFKTRRRYYLLFSSVLAAVAWIVLGFVPKTYGSLLLGVILVDLFVVMISTVTGAFLVELGQSRGEVGKLSAVRQITRSVGFTIQGPLGGLLAGTAFMTASGIGAGIALSIFPIAYYFMREQPVVRNPAVLQNASKQLKVLARSGPFWLAILFMGLYYFAPGLPTLSYYRQNDVLHMSQLKIGYLGADSNVAGIAAAFGYIFLARRVPLRTSILLAVVTSVIAATMYVFYNSVQAAFVIEFQNGFFAGFAQVVFLDLAARATPAGCEGLGYSFMMSILNVSSQGSDWLGSHLSNAYNLSWNTMVFINAGTTLIVLVLLPFMPRAMMASRDSQRLVTSGGLRDE